MSIGIQEIILILLAVLLLFGGKGVPEFARTLGRAVKEFRKAKDLIQKETDEIAREFREKPVEYQLKDDIKEPQV